MDCHAQWEGWLKMGGRFVGGNRGREVGKRSVDQRRRQPHLCLRAAQFVQTNQENDPGDTFLVPHTTCMQAAETSSCLVMR